MGALIERGLTGEGYDITLVTNGVDALIAAANSDFAAAAIDVMMPEMTGFEVCRHLRQHGSTLPVLLITARDAIEDRVFGLDSGADDYLTKPFAFAEFSARIRALVRRDASMPKPVLRLGALALDTASVRATVGDTPLPLSTKNSRYCATSYRARERPSLDRKSCKRSGARPITSTPPSSTSTCVICAASSTRWLPTSRS